MGMFSCWIGNPKFALLDVNHPTEHQSKLAWLQKCNHFLFRLVHVKKRCTSSLLAPELANKAGGVWRLW